MMGYKLFTLDEARQLLPALREMVESANSELAGLLETVRVANARYETAETRLGEVKAPDNQVTDLSELRESRTQFQDAIEALSRAQNEYVKTLNFWVEKITERGVILRDLREGLLDFPAQDGDLEYLLCWKIDEPDIHFWHLESDGFRGRKPLVTLDEYR
jgi:hypothetical protein